MKSFLPLFALCAACGAAADTSPRQVPGQPPPRPDASAGLVPATTATTTWAIDRISLGEAPLSGPPSDVAWRSFGFDLDHHTTTKDSTDVCTLAAGSPKFTQADGDFGIDNSWGATLLPILQTAASLPTPSVTLSDAIAKGAATLELEVTGLPGDTSASAVGLSLSTFVAGPVTSKPFGATVSRPVAASSQASFADAYVNAGTFVSGPSADPLMLRLTFAAPLDLVIRAPVVTFQRAADGSITGTVAGVLDTDAFVVSAFSLGTAIFPPMCTDPTQFDGIADQIRQAQDIVHDGTNRSGVPCDGMSIGLAFHATPVANPTEDVELAPPPTCN